MNRVVARFVALVGLALGFAASCTVSFPDAGAQDTFPCESAEDCVEGQRCANIEGTDQKVCTEDDSESECIDEDGDGRGSDKAPQNECPACLAGEPGGCQVDCADNDPNVFPGNTESCNGKDDNCDGKTEAETPIGAGCTPTSEGGDGCPLTGSKETPQSGTSWGCEEVGGTFQCVLTGTFSGSAERCTRKEGWGICADGNWGEVPQECTNP